jgi:predicted secreted protein
MSLVVTFILGVSYSYGNETVIVNKEFNGREIKVRAGGSIHIDLEELGSAGYTWAMKDLDKEHFEVLTVDSKDIKTQGDVTGAPVIKKWLISAKKQGFAELKLLYYRPWEGEKSATETFILKVRIL